MIHLIWIMFLFAGAAEGIMDWLQFRLSEKPDHNLYLNEFWNPRKSWARKWKKIYINQIPTYLVGEEAFPLSSTTLVFLTDGWHLMKWCRNRFLDIAFAAVTTKATDASFWYILLFIFDLRFVYGIGFWLTYKKIL